MAYDDKKLGRLFPTRTGPAIGTANERKMLDALGGSDSFRTRIEKDLSAGTTTVLRTKNGMPRFYTTVESSEQENPVNAYVETGELAFSFPGEETPSRLDPAKLYFNDLDKQGRWLGKIKCEPDKKIGAQVKRQPTPVDTGVLRDGIDSLAIGYPRQAYPDGSINTTEDDEVKNEYQYATIMKKVVAGMFAPSLFSGKLRAFMQAQYGAKEKKEGFNFYIDLLGSTALLYYQPISIEGARAIQFQFWSHGTTGLFSAPKYQYYLLQVTNSNTPGLVDIVGYPIKLSSSGKALRKALLKKKITQANEHKAEAYMFAEAVIETNKPFYVGSFIPGPCGVNGAGPLAFGWKFNKKGTRCSIVNIGSVGRAEGHSLDGRTQEVHVSIERLDVYDKNEAGKWSVSVSSSAEYNWLDGWGYFNIMAPKNETSFEIEAFNKLKMTWGTIPDYSYTNVPVYGYYDSLDNWVCVRMSKDTTQTGQWEQEAEGVLVSPERYAQPIVKDTGPTPDLWEYYSVRKNTTTKAYCEMRHVTEGQHMSIDVGGWEYKGHVKAGEFSASAEHVTGSGAYSEFSPFYEGWILGPPYEWAPIPGGYSRSSFLLSQPDCTGATGSDERPPITFYRWGGYFYESHVWTLTIPCRDCEAVHVMVEEYRDDTNLSGSEAQYNTWGGNLESITFQDESKNEVVAHSTRWIKFQYTKHAVTWVNTAEEPKHFSENARDKKTYVYAFSNTLQGHEGTPSGSYTTLFEVDRAWPFFNGAIVFRESSHGHYYGTEGFNSGGVLKNSLFVGWY